MSFKEVTSLRKSGKLDEAYQMAHNDLAAFKKDANATVASQDNNTAELWSKRAMAWVCYEYLRKFSQQKNYGSFLEYLIKIRDLQLPADEKLLFDSCAWSIGSMIFTLGKQEPVDYVKINEVFGIIRDFPFSKPSEAYSFIYKAFHKTHTNWPRYLEFADWWDFENFRPEDYLKNEFEGKKIMSIVEQAYIAYARKALSEPEVIDGFLIHNSVNKLLLSSFLPKLDSLIEKYPDFQYPPYFKAKFLLALGEKDNILSAILPFAKSKHNDFWVWDVLSDAYPIDDELHMACLCRSLLCRALNEFLVKVFEKLSAALISRQMYAEAKYLIETAIQTKEAQGWAITGNLKKWVNQPWYKETNATTDIMPFLKKHAALADELLYFDDPEELIVVEFVNSDKKVLSFIITKDKSGFFKYEGKIESPKVGDVFLVRIKPIGQEGFYQLITIKKTEEKPDKTVLREFKGGVYVHPEKGFGLADNVFIDTATIIKKAILDKDIVEGRAIVSFNKQKGNWGWKAIEIKK